VMIGPDIAPLGEMHDAEKIYQNQIASTAAMLMGENFKTSHKTGKAITSVITSPVETQPENFVQQISSK